MAEKNVLLDAILKNGKYTFNITLSKFLRVLLKNNRFICVYDIMFLYTKYLNKFLKQLDVIVFTAHKTNKDLNNNITSVLTKVLKSQIKLTHLTDTSLIGGTKIRIENYLLDDTISNKLSSLKKCLINVNVR
jgi:F-type H+-transporting ATPase subunit delta